MIKSYLIVIATIALFSCRENERHQPSLSKKELEKKLIEVNKQATEIESNQIDAYVKRRQLNVIKTPTGLRYDVYNNLEGTNVKEGQHAVVKYTVSLINGKECYNTNDTAEVFSVGKDNVETGLHEGITYMSKGDKAIIIIPSHLAHGLTGDYKKIPIRSTIIYDIELVDIK